MVIREGKAGRSGQSQPGSGIKKVEKILRMSFSISGLRQPVEELRSFAFTNDHLIAKGHIKVHGKFSREEVGYVSNCFAAYKELAVCPEK